MRVRGKFLAWVVATATVIPLLDAAAARAQCADFNDDGSVTASDALNILNVAVGLVECDVYRCDLDDSGTITPTDALNTLMFAVGHPITLGCPEDPTSCQNDLEFFFESIWTPVQSDCVSCHNPNGIASGTDHVLLDSSVIGYIDFNFQNWKDLYDDGKGDLLLSKPQGIAHGGGQRLGMTPSSIHYANILELFDRFDNPVTTCSGSQSFWAGVTTLTDHEVLRKASLLFAGRPPTQSEENLVDDSRLRRAIRTTMAGDDFEDFLRESANDHFLTDKFLIRQSNAFGVLKGDYQYPDLYERINLIEALLGEEEADEAWWRTNRALAREPLELIVNIAKKERPYTEVVTANYVMVNPWSATVYQAGVGLGDDWNENNWKEGTINGYRLPGYPHAGVLTSPMFLNRFPSTATNRNRHRARMAYKFFLGVDIESLSPRTVNPVDLDDNDNPTMFNTNCTVCHTVMDPAAGTFQNFGDDGLFLENDSDSLPRSYKETELYHQGDRWYGDMRSPGFGNRLMPAGFTNDSISWLGANIAADPRFARGAVEFWYEAVFGRPPLARPIDPTDVDYRATLEAWSAQDRIFEGIAEKFRGGYAGTGTHGAFNLKDLLVELAVSPLFTADTATDTSGARAIELGALGFNKLLTPEQLNRKFESLTGYRWGDDGDDDEPDLTGRYRIFYGGIDSSGIVERATELNALMSTVPQRMAYEMACPIVLGEFSERQNNRLLLSMVEPDDEPSTTSGAFRIRQNIAWLHQWLLGEVLQTDDPEIDRTYQLFYDIWDLRTSQNKSTNLRSSSNGHCDVDFGSGDFIETDEHHTIRSWTAVLAYLLNDHRFIYE